MWFCELSNSRTEGFNSRNPILYSEIKAYFDLMKIEPTEQEVGLIKRFDAAYMQFQRSKQK